MLSPGRQRPAGEQQNERSMSALTPPKPPRTPRQSSTSSTAFGQTPPSPISFDIRNVINSQDLLEIAACPCCKQCIDEKQQQTLSGPRMIADPYTSTTNDNGDIDSDDEDTLPQGVAEGLKYQPRRILVEGWLHKKGTGNDWLGTKSWKPRWARLVMAKLEGFEVNVPLLMVYWNAGTSSPSNVIILDSTVAFPIDLDDKERWDAFRFDVRNARSVATNTTVNRTFCAPKKARDAWIYAISQALLIYEKENDRARKAAIQASEARRLTPQPVACCDRPMNPPFEEVWSGDRFVTPSKGSPPKKGFSSPPRMPSPPSSPKPRNSSSVPAKRNIPRPSASHHLPKAATEKC